MSTYDDLVETLPMRRKAARLNAIADGVAAAVEANRQLREGRLALDPSYKPDQLTVWLLWHNDACLGVLGSYDSAWEKLHDAMSRIGGVWRAVPHTRHLRWTNDTMAGCRVQIEPHEVVF